MLHNPKKYLYTIYVEKFSILQFGVSRNLTTFVIEKV